MGDNDLRTCQLPSISGATMVAVDAPAPDGRKHMAQYNDENGGGSGAEHGVPMDLRR